MRFYWVALSMLVFGCADGRSSVEISVESTGIVRGIDHFTVVVSDTQRGLTTAPINVALTGAPVNLPPAQTFFLNFDASVSGPIHLSLDAVSASGSTLVHGEADVVVAPSKTIHAVITLAGEAPVGDMGVTDSGNCSSGYHNGGDGKCVLLGTCSIGYHDSGTGVCIAAGCAADYYYDGTTCHACSGACPSGQYQSAACSATADRACTNCTAITDCASEICTSNSDQACTSCNENYWLSDGTCHACAVCAAGTFQNTACTAMADTVCTVCSAGTYSSTAGATTCTACTAGTDYASGSGATACTACSGACPAGNYQSSACTVTANRGCTACTATLTISDAPTYNYGAQFMGSSTTKTFTVTNSGGNPAVIGTLSTSELGLTAPYVYAGGTCSSSTVAASGSCMLDVTFLPTVANQPSGATVTLPYQNCSASKNTTRSVTGSGWNCLTSQCFPVPPTNQTSCYDDVQQMTSCPTMPCNGADSWCGQDAQYASKHNTRTFTCYNAGGAVQNPCNGTAVTNEVVTDSLTNLMWQRTWAPGMSVQLAISYCYNLVYGGYDDWRLPSPLELQSIVDDGRSNPSINLAAFPGTPAAWALTPLASPYPAPWFVDFVTGYIIDGGSYDTFVRCVRGGMSPATSSRFVISGSSEQVVTDSVTGLIWQKSYGTGKTWQQALVYCEGLTYGGQSDWRLPNKKEALSLVNYGRQLPPSDFPDMPAGERFWSSSTYTNIIGNAWVVLFWNGPVIGESKYEGKNARCVRGGP